MHRIIAICDTNEERRRKLTKLLQRYDDAPLLFSKTEELSVALRRGAQPLFAFLRADENEERLRSCAVALHRRRPFCSLLLISDSSAGALLGFSLQADDFLLSPVSQEALDECLARQMRKNPCVFRSLSVGLKKPELWVKDIMFIESLDHNCRIILADGTVIHVRESLSRLEKETDGCRFFRCHRSFLVNFCFVKKYTDGMLYLQREQRVPVSKSLLAQTEEAYRLHLLRRQFLVQ